MSDESHPHHDHPGHKLSASFNTATAISSPEQATRRETFRSPRSDSVHFFLAGLATFYNISRGKQNFLEFSAPLLFFRSKNSKFIPKCLNSSF